LTQVAVDNARTLFTITIALALGLMKSLLAKCAGNDPSAARADATRRGTLQKVEKKRGEWIGGGSLR
jgi:hypothetical protein